MAQNSAGAGNTSINIESSVLLVSFDDRSNRCAGRVERCRAIRRTLVWKPAVDAALFELSA